VRMTCRPRRALYCVLTTAVALGVAACTGSSNGSSSVSVFDVHRGDCFSAPGTVKAELSDLTRVACSTSHTQELYAAVDYLAKGTTASAPPSASGTPYPGADVLDKYAKGTCAQRFTTYVGVDYLSSALFFTYLLPSARSWEQDSDRTVLCFITTTGGKLTSSVKGSRR
jgi:Septum formation